jgi:dihydrofolate reductase
LRRCWPVAAQPYHLENAKTARDASEEVDMRTVEYYVASTVDGFIAHEDHTVEGFAPPGDHADDYFAALRTRYDVVIMGRKTYEFGLRLGVTNPYPWMKRQIVFSRTMQESPDEQVEVISRDIVGLVNSLKQEAGKAIYLCGGGELAGILFAHRLIDELIVKLNPVLFGTGIPLVAAPDQSIALELASSKIYASGVAVLHYRVKY